MMGKNVQVGSWVGRNQVTGKTGKAGVSAGQLGAVEEEVFRSFI